jgi:O-antigen/teichoic acid export membrane protein
MQIDKTQRRWGLASLGILAAALVIYLLYAWSAPQGPRGGSAIGLFFGVVGFGFMIFAALLGARKRVPTWRLGRAKAWMKGHLWLGLLALPMILFHGGFNFGGTLTRMLMWLLIITVASGLYGAVLQNSIPKKMTADIPLETIYDEISHVRTLLREKQIARWKGYAAIWD